MVNIKKIIKILCFNILFSVLIFIAAEIYCIFDVYFSSVWKSDVPFSIHLKQLIAGYKKDIRFDDYEFRPASYGSSAKRPLALMGCSFAYGTYLQENETPSAVLSRETGRTVYNAGIQGGSPREMLYILRDDELREKLFHNDKNIEYFIYPFISDHMARMYADIRLYTAAPAFKKTPEGLVYYKRSRFPAVTQLYKKCQNAVFRGKNDITAFNLIKDYLIEINKEIKKHFPNAVFAVLVYEDFLNHDWKPIEDEGIIVIKLSSIFGNDYFRTEEYRYFDYHPKAAAWEKIVPALIEQMKLNKE